jgi:hypothetical protein
MYRRLAAERAEMVEKERAEQVAKDAAETAARLKRLSNSTYSAALHFVNFEVIGIINIASFYVNQPFHTPL